MRGPPLYSPRNKPASLPLAQRPHPWGDGIKISHAPWLAERGAPDPAPAFPRESAPEFRSHFRRLAGYAEPHKKDRGVTGMKENVKAIARPAASRSLRDAIRKARLEEAERLDGTADARDGEMARLELLRSELEGVFAEIPNQDDRFNLALVPSRPARLWIDLFTYVAVDEGSGAYLFIRNSEDGRRTLFSAANVADMADRITKYIAQEIVRRERMEAALQEPRTRQKLALDDDEPSEPRLAIVLSAFIIGVVTGAVGLFASVWLSIP
jgi:hypothetical protein